MPPASPTEILNLALIEIGEAPIANMDTGTGPAAENGSRIYGPTRDEVLASHEWNEAMRRQALALLSDAPAFNYARAFQLPADFIRLSRASDLDIDYTIEANKMLTDEASLSIVYIFRQEDIAHYSPGLVNAIAMKLAAKLAMSLRSDRALKRDMEAKFQAVIQQAQYQDATQMPLRQLQPGGWIGARNKGISAIKYSDWSPR